MKNIFVLLLFVSLALMPLADASRYLGGAVTADNAAIAIDGRSQSVPFRFSPGDVFWLVADTDTNSAGVNCRFSLLEYKIN